MKTHRQGTRRGIFVRFFLCLILAVLANPPSAYALPPKLELLVDERDTSATRLISRDRAIPNGASRLSVKWAVFADMNQHGMVNEIDTDLVADAIVWNTNLIDVPLIAWATCAEWGEDCTRAGLPPTVGVVLALAFSLFDGARQFRLSSVKGKYHERRNTHP